MLCSTPKAELGWSCWAGATFGGTPIVAAALAKERAASGSIRHPKALATTLDSSGGGSMTASVEEGERWRPMTSR
jgi:hypothetical protein